MITVAAATGIIMFLIGTWLAWQEFGPSKIGIRNAGDKPARLVLTDADHRTPAWSGELGPGRRKMVMLWFRHEGTPLLHCRDQTASNRTELQYVSGHMPLSAEIEITGCAVIKPTYSR